MHPFSIQWLPRPSAAGARGMTTALLACLAFSTVPATAQQGWTGVATDIALESGAEPRLVVDERGGAIATWRAGPILRAARYLPESAWSQPVDIVEASIVEWRGYDVIVDAAGNATIAWSMTGTGIETVRYSVASGDWSPAVVVGPGDYFGAPDLAVDPAGNILAVWAHFDEGSVWSARFSASAGAWSPPAPAGQLTGTNVQSAVDVDGNVGNGFEVTVATLNTADTVTVGADVLVGS